MGIDGIGKGGPPPPPDAAAGGVEKKGGVETPFARTLERPDAAGGVGAPEQAGGVGGAGAVAGSSPLQQLRAGQIDVDRYMDLKVAEATRGLQGLSPAALDDIKKLLKEQMATDPGMSDLFHRATGKVPTPPED